MNTIIGKESERKLKDYDRLKLEYTRLHEEFRHFICELKKVDDALRVFQLYRNKGGQPETAMDRRLKKAKAITEKYLSNH